MYQHQIQIRVRYAETDQMGYVYYGNYASYYEVGRVEAFRNLGFSYKKLEESGIMMPVLENYSKFINAAKYDDLLTITVSIPQMPTARITFNYDITNEAGALIHEGRTSLAFVNMSSGRPCRAPEKMLSLLQPYFNEE